MSIAVHIPMLVIGNNVFCSVSPTIVHCEKITKRIGEKFPSYTVGHSNEMYAWLDKHTVNTDNVRHDTLILWLDTESGLR